MGRAMADRLVEAGHRLRVWNRSRPATHEAFREVLISMLADDTAVRAVILGSGMLDRAPRGGIHVNMATISVALAEELTEEHRRRGLH